MESILVPFSFIVQFFFKAILLSLFAFIILVVFNGLVVGETWREGGSVRTRTVLLSASIVCVVFSKGFERSERESFGRGVLSLFPSRQKHAVVLGTQYCHQTKFVESEHTEDDVRSKTGRACPGAHILTRAHYVITRQYHRHTTRIILITPPPTLFPSSFPSSLPF